MIKSKSIFVILLAILTYSVSGQVSSRSRQNTGKPGLTTRRTASRTPVRNAPQIETFSDHLYYGGGIALSFNGGSGNVSGSVFNIGLSPLVGYKFNKVFSAGPRFDFLYTHGRFQAAANTPVAKFNGFDYGAGVFARAKIGPQFFVHAEYGFINREYPYDYNTNLTEILTTRQSQNQFLGGLGYNSGGILATEIYLLYDFINKSTSTQLPLVYRFGITYKFNQERY